MKLVVMTAVVGLAFTSAALAGDLEGYAGTEQSPFAGVYFGAQGGYSQAGVTDSMYAWHDYENYNNNYHPFEGEAN